MTELHFAIYEDDDSIWEVTTRVDVEDPASILSAAKGAAEMYIDDLEAAIEAANA